MNALLEKHGVSHLHRIVIEIPPVPLAVAQIRELRVAQSS